MTTPTLTYKADLHYDDLIVREKNHAIRALPSGFVIEQIEIRVQLDRIELFFNYLIPEVEKRQEPSLPSSVSLYLGKFTNKFIKAVVKFSSIDDVSIGIDQAQEQLRLLIKEASQLSLKLNYKICEDLLKFIKPQIIQRLPVILADLKSDYNK